MIKNVQGVSVDGEGPENVEDIIFPSISLTCKIHFGLIFEMGE